MVWRDVPVVVAHEVVEPGHRRGRPRRAGGDERDRRDERDAGEPHQPPAHTYPSRRSCSRASAERSAGGPKPPPPHVSISRRSPRVRRTLTLPPMSRAPGVPGLSVMRYGSPSRPPCTPHGGTTRRSSMLVSVASGATTRYARRKPRPPRCRPSPAEPGRSACSSTRSGYSASTTSLGVFITFDMYTRMALAPSRAARLWRRAAEIERRLVAADLHAYADRQRRCVHAVVVQPVLARPHAVGQRAQGVAHRALGRRVQRLEARAQRVGAVSLDQLADASRRDVVGRELREDVAAPLVGAPEIRQDDLDLLLVGPRGGEQAHGRDAHALL